MTSTTRIIDRHVAVTEIADSIRDRLHWVVSVTPDHISRISNAVYENWDDAVVYLDNATGLVLAGDARTAKVSSLLLPALGIDICCIFIVEKADATATELADAIGFGESIPDDGSQDLVLFTEELDDTHQITYMPTLLLDVVKEIDG